jgi:hypothetical protein
MKSAILGQTGYKRISTKFGLRQNLWSDFDLVCIDPMLTSMLSKPLSQTVSGLYAENVIKHNTNNFIFCAI